MEQKITFQPILFHSDEPKEKLKEITNKLEEGVQKVFQSETYREYLDFMAKFHCYSARNCILIKMQMPEASQVASYTDWKRKFHRQVRKGEKGIKILAPSPYKMKKRREKMDPETKKPMKNDKGECLWEEIEVTVPYFKIVTVFDVSQTEGQELPKYRINELQGDVNQFSLLFSAFKNLSPYPIYFKDLPETCYGCTDYQKRKIFLKEGISELQTLKTAIHEISHATQHDTAHFQGRSLPERSTCEVQAESIAYVLCQYYGLDTSNYSFSYIAHWSSQRDEKQLKESLDLIRGTSHRFIQQIDESLFLSKEKSKVGKSQQSKENRRKGRGL